MNLLVARLAGLEPTASAFAGLRSIHLSYKRRCLGEMVPKERFELSRPCGHYALNVARLPFRHFGVVGLQASVNYTERLVYCQSDGSYRSNIRTGYSPCFQLTREIYN